MDKHQEIVKRIFATPLSEFGIRVSMSPVS